MNEKQRFLLVEDCPTDAELIRYELVEAGLAFTMKTVMTEADFVRELQMFWPNLILSDYDLPTYSGALALAEAKRRSPHIPFIFVTDAGGQDRGIDAIIRKATDCVPKSRLDRLAPAIRGALAKCAGAMGKRCP